MAREAVKSEEIVLSCKEAQLLLKTIQLDQDLNESLIENSDLTQEQIASPVHYANCDSCKDVGLSNILDISVMSCEEALKLWSTVFIGLSPFSNVFGSVYTLEQKLALEHMQKKE